MSGHSKWATTKHKKAVIDGRRAKNFAKLIKAIEVAARNVAPMLMATQLFLMQSLRRRRIPCQRITSIAP
jgi:transcriptional/translational regulatory protein YebC/TACO1